MALTEVPQGRSSRMGSFDLLVGAGGVKKTLHGLLCLVSGDLLDGGEPGLQVFGVRSGPVRHDLKDAQRTVTDCSTWP